MEDCGSGIPNPKVVYVKPPYVCKSDVVVGIMHMLFILKDGLRFHSMKGVTGYPSN